MIDSHQLKLQLLFSPSIPIIDILDFMPGDLTCEQSQIEGDSARRVHGTLKQLLKARCCRERPQVVKTRSYYDKD